MIINPRTNKPFTASEIAQLSTQQSRAYTTGVRKPAEQKSLAQGLTPNKLAAVLRNAITGDLEDYFILAEEMEERDLHYRAVLSTRKLAVSAIEPSVEAASDDKLHQDHAVAVREFLKTTALAECCFDLLDGLGKGVSVVEMGWQERRGQLYPAQFWWVDPRFLKVDKEDLTTLLLLDEGEPKPFKACGVIIHKPRMKSGHFIRNGLARLVAVMYMLKSYTVKDWWAFAEVFGMPIRIGKYHQNASDEDIRTLITAIASIASDAGAAIPETMQIDMVETAKGNGGDTLFQSMAQWADEQISKAVLGQTMTTDNGSSQSQANVHNEVRKDIIRWDARQLADTLNEYVVKPFIDLNYGKQDAYPTIKLTLDEPEDTKAFVDALTPLIDRGLKVQASDIRDRLGIPDPDQGGELLHPVNHQEPSLPSLNRQQMAFNRQLNMGAELDQLALDALDEWAEVGAPIVNPVLALAKRSASYEDFAAGLAQLSEQLDSSALVEQLTRLCFLARALGDVDE
ncbi:MAG: DUF935 domain-containing protein [Vibrio sp.]